MANCRPQTAANIATRQTINKIMQTDTYFAEQSAKAAWNTVARDLACLAERWEAEAASCDKAKGALGNDPVKVPFYDGTSSAFQCPLCLQSV